MTPHAHLSSMPARRRAARAGLAVAWALAALLGACGGGDAVQAPAEPPPTLGKPLGTVEIDIIGLGTAKPSSSMRWDGVAPQKQAQGLLKTAAAAAPSATIAATTNLPGGLDMQPQSASAIDTNGTRYISVTYRVRNAQFNGVTADTAGQGLAYGVARSNLTFLAVVPSTGINGSAITRFVKYDGSPADQALAWLLVPTHGMDSMGTTVEAARASMQVYRESELPAPDASVTDVLPYGFVVNNVNDGSRTLPANPAPGQFDGLVTFAFKLPLQANTADNPFKISLRFQVMEDSNTRVTRSLEDTDATVSARAAALGTTDIAVLCDKVLNLPTTNPICSVRLAGPAAAPTALISTATPATTLKVISSPNGLANVPTTAEVVVGTSQVMNAPTASTLVVNGSQSGRRTLTGAYSGVLDGGGTSGRPAQLVFKLRPQDRPFFRGEVVSFTATAGNSSTIGTPLPAFAGQFNTQGASAGALATLGAASTLGAGTTPQSVVVADFNGDGLLDVASGSTSGVYVSLGNSSGGLDPAVNFGNGSANAPTVPALVAADMNNDGKLDLVVMTTPSTPLLFRILIGDGTGQFTAGAPRGTGVSPIAPGMVVADVNRDGNLDVMFIGIVNIAGTGVRPVLNVSFGNGAGGFTNTPVNTVMAASNVPHANMVAADFNGDGFIDLACVTGSSVSIYLGNGAGRFGGATSNTTPAVAVATVPISTTNSMLAVGDVNGDGKPDLLVSSVTDAKVYVLLGDGTGKFATPVGYAVGSNPQNVSLADLNGDGLLDIVVVNGGGASVSVLLNTGGGLFGPASPYAVGASPRGLAVGDLNGDGKLDLVVGSSGSSATSLSVLLGN